MNSTKFQLIKQVLDDEKLSSINIFGVQLKSIVVKLQKSEIYEIINNISHIKNHRDPSWYDFFISTRERGISIDCGNVTKKRMKKLLENRNAIQDMMIDEILKLPPTGINLRILASRFGYCYERERVRSQHEYCRMVGLPCIQYGYQNDIKLLAKYSGMGNAYKLSSRASFEFLGMQPYPRTIDELADIDEERFNHDVIDARAYLRLEIYTFSKITKPVKVFLAKFGEYKYSSQMTSKELDQILY